MRLQRLVFAAAVAAGVALHPPASVVDGVVGELDDVKGVDDDLGGVQAADQGVAIALMRIQGDALDGGQPRGRRGRPATG